MGIQPIDITNKKFNQLTAICYDHKKKQGKGEYHFWKFKCDCGALEDILVYNVT